MKKLLFTVLVLFLSLSCVFAAEKNRPSVAVVLSGGGAKGIAHIAALKSLEEHGVPIDKVYGTSMGALIGGIYAAGYSPADIYALVTDNDLNSMFKTILSPGYEEMPEPYSYKRNNVVSIAVSNGVMGTNALLDDYAIMNFFDNAVGNLPDNLNFETDLCTAFTCNGSDMIHGGHTLFTEGNLITAMRASMSIPVAFTPVRTPDGNIYTDGGLYRNLLVQNAIDDGYDIVIAVTLPTDSRRMAEGDYNSLSGLVEGALIISLQNASEGQAEMADFVIPIDVTGFTVLGFDKGLEIYQRGLDEVEKNISVIEKIASCFTEEQKEYKDPERKGEYFSKYENVPKVMRKPAYEEQHEDAYAKTRVSLGLGGQNSFFHDSDYENKKDSDYFAKKNTLMTVPYISARVFFKDVKGSKVSLEGKFNAELSRTIDLTFNALYRLTEDKGNRKYGILGIEGQVGSLGYLTDNKAAVKLNDIESRVSLNGGIKFTNEESYNVNVKAYLDYLRTSFPLVDYGNDLIDGIYSTFYPKAEIGGVYYGDIASRFLGSKTKRFDFTGRLGWLKNIDGKLIKTYKITGYADASFALSDKNSISFDFETISSREPVYLRSSYSEYGAWDGIPGFSNNTLYREFIMAGVTYQHLFKEGFIDRYLIVQFRAGVKSGQQFLNAYSVDSIENDVQVMPYKDCIDLLKDNWKENIDMGVGIGIGLDAAVGGDIIFGVGFSNRKTMSVYFELK